MHSFGYYPRSTMVQITETQSKILSKNTPNHWFKNDYYVWHSICLL